jgi:outer membrane protein TolC
MPILSASVMLALAAGGASAAPLSLAQAVQVASGSAPLVQVANYRADGVQAHEGVVRAPLLPGISAGMSQVSRSYNVNTFGIPFRNPARGRSFPTFDARVRGADDR